MHWAAIVLSRGPVRPLRSVARLLPSKRGARAAPPQPWTQQQAVSPEQAGVGEQQLSMPRVFERLAAPPLFITGVARSGTTWTLDLFAAHPEVCALYETWLVTRHGGVTGAFHQPQWERRWYEQRRDELGFEHGAVQLLPYEDLARDLGEVVARWLVRALEPQHRFLVEKGPVEISALAAMFPQARLIHVVRDGRDVALSMRAGVRSWARGMVWEGSFAELGERWRSGLERFRAEGEALGDGYLEVRYEDLRSDTLTEMRSLYEFAGIPCDDQQLAQICERTTLDSYGSGPRASGFRGRGSVSGGRGRLSREEGCEFDSAAGELLVELGYEPDRDWWQRLPAQAGGS